MDGRHLGVMEPRFLGRTDRLAHWQTGDGQTRQTNLGRQISNQVGRRLGKSICTVLETCLAARLKVICHLGEHACEQACSCRYGRDTVHARSRVGWFESAKCISPLEIG